MAMLVYQRVTHEHLYPTLTIGYVLGRPPAQDASHYQDWYCIFFSKGSRTKPSFVTVTGKGDNPRDIYIYIFIYMIQHIFLVYLVRILLYTVCILQTNKLARVVNTGGVSFPWSEPTR